MHSTLIRLKSELSKSTHGKKVDEGMKERLLTVCNILLGVAEDAEVKPENEGLRSRIEEVKEKCYDVMDLLEEVKVARVELCFCNPVPPSRRRLKRMVEEFEGLSRHRDLFRSGVVDFFKLGPVADMETGFQPRSHALYGRDYETEFLWIKLFDPFGNNNSFEDIRVISVVGAPGIGKTAVAKYAFQFPIVRYHFEIRAWISAFEDLDLIKFLKVFIEIFTNDVVYNVETEVLQLRFRQIVEKKRCLVVLDDVSQENPQHWLHLKKLFKFCDPRSRILITTRNQEVAHNAGSLSTDILELRGLSEEACLSIFKDCALVAPEAKIPNELRSNITNICNGSPLNAESLGRFIYRRPVEEWPEALKGIDIIHKLSYYPGQSTFFSVSPILRQCLLYCCIFPKNYSIDADTLIKLWMAQGFISSSDQDEEDMEKQAWRCIKELLDRYIFEESKIDDNGNFKFRLEGRMGDFVKFYVGGEYQSRFLDYYYDKEPTQKGLITRHYTLNVGVQASLPESKRLRALHLSSCSIKELPQNIAHLLHLRYLDLSFNHDLKKLPKAICSLLHLQTLNLNGCDSLQKLPKDIGKLVNLLYLEILWTTSLSYLPKGIATLTMLRRLNRFFGNSSANNSKACNLGDLENLNKIRGHITIDGLGAEADVSGAKKASLKNKKDLLGLELWFSFVGSQRKDEAVLEALEAPPGLQGLGIFYYQGESFPNWMTALQNLTHVMLADCSNCSDLPPLGKLLALQSLTIKNMSKVNMVGSGFLGIQLNNAAAGAESSGSSSSQAFPKLQELCFEKLNNWENWIGIGDDGDCAKVIMPSLSSLSIINCSKLRTIPNYIKLKTNLSGGIKRCPSLDLSQHQLSSIFQGTTTTDKVRSS
ncbi:hypothetical protein HN873_005754 [Arachis hypogaea]|nr:Putative disease resistance protein [Arachis hypogaea]